MPKMLTLPEAAERLRLSRSTIYHLTSGRAIPHFKIGQRLLFDEEELEAWLERHRVTPLANAAIQPGTRS